MDRGCSDRNQHLVVGILAARHQKNRHTGCGYFQQRFKCNLDKCLRTRLRSNKSPMHHQINLPAQSRLQRDENYSENQSRASDDRCAVEEDNPDRYVYQPAIKDGSK